MFLVQEAEATQRYKRYVETDARALKVRQLIRVIELDSYSKVRKASTRA